MKRVAQKILDEKTNPWGVTVQSVEIRDVKIPEALEDAMSRQAQAEHQRQDPVWRLNLGQGIYNTPALVGGVLYVGTASPEGRFYAFDVAIPSLEDREYRIEAVASSSSRRLYVLRSSRTA